MDERLRRAISGALGIDAAEIDSDSAIGLTENWDSLAQFNIAAAVEAEFGCQIPFDRISTLDSAAKLAEFLSRARGAA